jgi:hypothetical protein
MTAKEHLQQAVDAMSEEEAAGILRLLSSKREGEDRIAHDPVGASVGDQTSPAEEAKPARGTPKGAVIRRPISLDVLARELGRFKRRG